MRRRYKIIGAAVLAVAMLLIGSAAGAALSSRSGSFSERQTFVRETDAWSNASAGWVNVPGAAVSVTVPSGTSRLIDARFTAESACTGGGWCSVRVVIVSPAGAVTELQPASGTDFAFDSGSGDLWESHAIERSSYFQRAGTYRVIVQSANVGGATVRLDDWHFTVETVRP